MSLSVSDVSVLASWTCGAEEEGSRGGPDQAKQKLTDAEMDGVGGADMPALLWEDGHGQRGFPSSPVAMPVSSLGVVAPSFPQVPMSLSTIHSLGPVPPFVTICLAAVEPRFFFLFRTQTDTTVYYCYYY